MSDPLASGKRAEQILQSDEWQQAWDAYRQRIFEEIEAAPSDATDKVMHLKRLLAAAKAAQAHLERLVVDGKVAAANLELEDKRRKTWRIF